MPPFWIIFEGVSPSYVMDKIDESVYFMDKSLNLSLKGIKKRP